MFYVDIILCIIYKLLSKKKLKVVISSIKLKLTLTFFLKDIYYYLLSVACIIKQIGVVQIILDNLLFIILVNS